MLTSFSFFCKTFEQENLFFFFCYYNFINKVNMMLVYLYNGALCLLKTPTYTRLRNDLEISNFRKNFLLRDKVKFFKNIF